MNAHAWEHCNAFQPNRIGPGAYANLIVWQCVPQPARNILTRDSPVMWRTNLAARKDKEM